MIITINTIMIIAVKISYDNNYNINYDNNDRNVLNKSNDNINDTKSNNNIMIKNK